MTHVFSDLFYQYEAQETAYQERASALKPSDKSDLLEHLLTEDLFAFQPIVIKLLRELASPTSEFASKVEKAWTAVAGDMGGGPTRDCIVDLAKEDLALGRYLLNYFLQTNPDEKGNLIGALLGGLTLIDTTDILSLASSSEYAKKFAAIAAARVAFKETPLPQELVNVVEEFASTGSVQDKSAVALLAIERYNNFAPESKTLFAQFVEQKDWIPVCNMIGMLTFRSAINDHEMFDLIKLAGDEDEATVDCSLNVIYNLNLKPSDVVDYYVPLLNAYKFKPHNIDWTLKHLCDKNPAIGEMILERNSEIFTGYYRNMLWPRLFEQIANTTLIERVKQSRSLRDAGLMQDEVFYPIMRTAVGKIYQDSAQRVVAEEILGAIIPSAAGRADVSLNHVRLRSKLETGSLQDYNFAIDEMRNAIDELEHPVNFNLDQCKEGLQRYPEVLSAASGVIDNISATRPRHSLLWMAFREEPDLQGIQFPIDSTTLAGAMQIQHVQGLFWPRAYLRELEAALPLYSRLNNARVSPHAVSSKVANAIEERFWTFYSELVLIKRISQHAAVVDVPIPHAMNNQDSDVKFSLTERDIFLEITRPQMPRELRLANGAVGLENALRDVVHEKYTKFHSPELRAAAVRREFTSPIIIAVDTSDSIIDSHHASALMHGSHTLTFGVDRRTGQAGPVTPSRAPDGYNTQFRRGSLLTGIVLFKSRLVFDDAEPRVVIVGEYVANPVALNPLSSAEEEELKRLLFQ